MAHLLASSLLQVISFIPPVCTFCVRKDTRRMEMKVEAPQIPVLATCVRNLREEERAVSWWNEVPEVK